MTATIISVFASGISGLMLLIITRYFNKRDALEQKRINADRQESVLILKSIHMLGMLTKANAVAIRDGKTNGELHAALDDFTQVESELYAYLLEQNAQSK